MEFRDRPFLEIDWFLYFVFQIERENFVFCSVGDDSDGGLLLVRLFLPMSHDVCLLPCCGCCKVWQVDRSSGGWVTKPLKDFHTRRPVGFSSSTLVLFFTGIFIIEFDLFWLTFFRYFEFKRKETMSQHVSVDWTAIVGGYFFLCVFFENVSHFLNEVLVIVIYPPLSVAWK